MSDIHSRNKGTTSSKTTTSTDTKTEKEANAKTKRRQAEDERKAGRALQRSVARAAKEQKGFLQSGRK